MNRYNALTHEQRMDALNYANEVRLARAAVKRRIFARPDRRRSWATCASVIHDPPEHLDGIRVRELLMATRSLGPAKVTSIMRMVGIGPSTRLSTLTDRQRRAIVKILDGGSMSNIGNLDPLLNPIGSFARERMFTPTPAGLRVAGR